jgi:hypothetical protein
MATEAEIQAAVTRIVDRVVNDVEDVQRSQRFVIADSTMTILRNLPSTMTIAQYETDVYARLEALKKQGI